MARGSHGGEYEDGWAILMMEAVQTSETLVSLHQSTWRYNPEDSQLRSHVCNIYTVIMWNVTKCASLFQTIKTRLSIGETNWYLRCVSSDFHSALLTQQILCKWQLYDFFSNYFIKYVFMLPKHELATKCYVSLSECSRQLHTTLVSSRYTHFWRHNIKLLMLPWLTQKWPASHRFGILSRKTHWVRCKKA
jgi:hypothetical protein